MLELAIGLIGFYLLCLFVVYVVLPVGSVLALIGIGIGLLIGAFSAVKCYVMAIARNIHPYDYYEDRSAKKQKYAARRSYFFGPGYVQLIRTVYHAWQDIWSTTGSFSRTRKRIANFTCVMVIRQVLWVVSWLFYGCAMASVGILGSLLTLALGLAHAAVLTTVMAVIYVLFSVTWVIDRLYLEAKAIRTSCPYDQTRAVIPLFECPSCNQVHDRLVPGPYGIWRRRCTCGHVLPTTFLLGRSNLKALCPTCGHALAASDVQQFSITMVGGISCGKTVLISSFYHELFAALDRNRSIVYEIPEMHREMFEDLEAWFRKGECPATYFDNTSSMYSILLKSAQFEVPKQFSVYDIAGEAFYDPMMSTMIPQKQMLDSDGIMLVIDPLSAIAMRNQARSEGDSTLNYSTSETATIINNFVTYLKSVLTNSKIRNKSQKPVMVVITKTDLSSISRHVSYHKIKTIMNSHPDAFASFDEARDAVCREFLIDIGLLTAVQSIEVAFSEVHYFPVSAIGHAPNGEECEPEHVMEPFCWLIEHAQPELASMMRG